MDDLYTSPENRLSRQAAHASLTASLDLRHSIFAFLLLVLAASVRAVESHPAEWAIGDVAGKPQQRVALLVNALVDGHRCRLQLDTGAPSLVIWEGIKPLTSKATEVTVEVAGIAKQVRAPREIVNRLAECSRLESIGTLGNRFFDGGTLSINLAVPSLTFAPGSTLSERTDTHPMFYIKQTVGKRTSRSERIGGHPLIELRASGRLLGYALFDTGSASFGLNVHSMERWNHATGGLPLRESEKVTKFVIQGWGRTHTCYRAESSIKYQIGGQELLLSEITFCPSIDFMRAIALEGLIGLQPFQDATITLDYVAGRWLVEAPDGHK